MQPALRWGPWSMQVCQWHRSSYREKPAGAHQVWLQTGLCGNRLNFGLLPDPSLLQVTLPTHPLLSLCLPRLHPSSQLCYRFLLLVPRCLLPPSILALPSLHLCNRPCMHPSLYLSIHPSIYSFISRCPLYSSIHPSIHACLDAFPVPSFLPFISLQTLPACLHPSPLCCSHCLWTHHCTGSPQ